MKPLPLTVSQMMQRGFPLQTGVSRAAKICSTSFPFSTTSVMNPKDSNFFFKSPRSLPHHSCRQFASRYDRSKRSSCQAGNGLPPCSPPIQFLPGILYLPKQRRYGTHCHMPSRPAPSRSQWNIPGQATPWILHPRTFISVGMALQSAVQLTKGRVFLFFNQFQFTHASI